MAKVKMPEDVLRPLTLGVLVIIFLTVIVLQFVNGRGGKSIEDTTSLPDLQDLIDGFVPENTTIDDIFQPRLSSAELKNEEIQILNKEADLLRIVIAKPSGAGPFPVAVLLHGDRSSSRETDDMADDMGVFLADELGIMTVVVDWTESDIGGNEIDDVVAALDWIENLNEATDQPIVIIGVDHGAYIAHLAAQRWRSEIAGVVAAYGVTSPRDRYTTLNEQGPDQAERYLEITGCTNAADRNSCLEGLSVMPGLVTYPLLAMHNRSDAFVGIEQSERISNTVDADLLTTYYPESESGDHGILEDHSFDGYDEAREQLITWLNYAFEEAESDAVQKFNEEIGKRIREPIIIGNPAAPDGDTLEDADRLDE